MKFWHHTLVRAVGVAAMTGGFMVAAPGAHATVPGDIIVGTAVLGTGALATEADGVVFGFGADPAAAVLIGAFDVTDKGTFTVPVVATPTLVEMAQRNGDRLNLFIGATEVHVGDLGTPDADRLVYQVEKYAEAVLTWRTDVFTGEREPAFDVPDPTGYILRLIDRVQDGPNMHLDTGIIDSIAESPIYIGQEPGEVAITVNGSYMQTATVFFDPTGVTPPVMGEAYNSITYATDALSSLYQIEKQVGAMADVDDASDNGGKYACVLNGDELRKRRLVAHPPKRTPAGWSWEGMDISYVWHMYQSNTARVVSNGGPTWQVESCQVGGAQTFAGYRLNRLGSAATSFEDPPTTKLAADWESGRDLPVIESSLYANVGADTDRVGIGASMSQMATGLNTGSEGVRIPAPADSQAANAFNRYKHNTGYGEWKQVCGWQTPKRNCGSRDFQSTTTQVLWEWLQTDPGLKTLAVAYPYQITCTTWNNSCPLK